MTMFESIHPRCSAAGIAALLLTLLPATGYNQVLAARAPQQVSLSAWIVLGTEDFKRGLQSADGKTLSADEPAIQAMLDEAVQNGAAELLAQPKLLTTERVAAEITVDLQVPFERAGQELIKTVRVELVMTPQIATAKDVALMVRLTSKLLTPATVSGTEVLTSDSRSLKSSALLPEGRTLILGGLIAGSDDLQLSKQKGKRREVLVLITPKVLGEAAQR
jgi:type II secretory pathway component GspD/PulD (secretin)